MSKMGRRSLKLRTLKAWLRRQGFRSRPGKGSHSIWTHPTRSGRPIVLSGADGREAKPYQQRRVRQQSHGVRHQPDPS